VVDASALAKHVLRARRARFLLDTNILVDFALDILREQLSDDERKAATFARARTNRLCYEFNNV